MGMPGKMISKGLISAKVDRMANHPEKAKRQMLFDALSAWQAPGGQNNYARIIFDVSKQALPPDQQITEGDVKYLEEYWFKEWWKEHQPIEPSIRQSLIVAMQLAHWEAEPPSRQPIDSYWICAGNHFEVWATRSPQQITRLTLTPDVPATLPVRLVNQELTDIWVIKPGNPVEITDSAFPPVELERQGRHYEVETWRLRQTR